MNMYVLAGWTEVGCTDSEIVRIDRADRVSSSLSDPEGRFGPPVIYTEWMDTEGRAVLRNYLQHPDSERPICRHFVPAGLDIDGIEH